MEEDEWDVKCYRSKST